MAYNDFTNINDFTTSTGIVIEQDDVERNLASGGAPYDWDDLDVDPGKGSPTWEWAVEYAENVINWDGETPITDEIVEGVVSILVDHKALDHRND